MTEESTLHVFDEENADRYRPNPVHAKTAILVDVVDDSTTKIDTRFGTQEFKGPFYIVVEGSSSYGAAKREFENSHVAAGPNRWRKSEPVLAYRAGETTTVATNIDNHRESTVTAEPGDWIVRQASGETQAIPHDEFVDRYIADDHSDDDRDDDSAAPIDGGAAPA